MSSPATPDRSLRSLFAPASVAVIGASDEPGSVGAAVFGNLRRGGYTGSLWPVNLRHATIAGQRAYATVAQLPQVPELAVICTPPAAVPAVVAQLAAAGTRAAVVLTAGLDQPGADGRSLAQAMQSAAQAHGLRILGPNCVGLRVPRTGLNASFSAIPARPGHLALVAQSGGVITAFLEWAEQRAVGFSCCVSLGNATDLDPADLLDALTDDAHTEVILLYLESVRDGRRLIQAATRAARHKPVFCLKAGRVREAALAAATHTGALAGSDAAWEAALRRAGVQRVQNLAALFGIAELVARTSTPPDARLAIVTNSGGPAVLAVDALVAGGGTLAELSASTIRQLDSLLPATWSRRNPVDIIGDAPPLRFAQALEVVAADASVGTTLVLHAPTDMAGAAEVLRACAQVAERTRHPTLICGMGDAHASTRMPRFATPEAAVGAMLDVVAADRLRRRPDIQAPAVDAVAPVPAALAAIRQRLRAEQAAGTSMLAAPLVAELLQAVSIPFVPTRIVPAAVELRAAAQQLGYPLVLKIVSAAISHKSDVGGVITGIADVQQLEQAAAQMLERCARLRPAARLDGFMLQPYLRPQHARELIVGISRDASFGPVVLFGHGGTAVHVLADTALGIAPFDAAQARDLIARTRVGALLAAYRDWPAADAAALQQVLVAVSQLAAWVPELLELDINPLLAHPGGAVALDVRIRLGAIAATTS